MERSRAATEGMKIFKPWQAEISYLSRKT